MSMPVSQADREGGSSARQEAEGSAGRAEGSGGSVLLSGGWDAARDAAPRRGDDAYGSATAARGQKLTELPRKRRSATARSNLAAERRYLYANTIAYTIHSTMKLPSPSAVQAKARIARITTGG